MIRLLAAMLIAIALGIVSRLYPIGWLFYDKSLGDVLYAVAAYLPHRPRPKDTSGLMKNLRLKDGRYYWHWDPRMFQSGGPRRDVDGLREAARALKVPTLLVRGQMSDVLSQEGVDDFPPAIGDPALFSAPYDSSWMLNRVADVQSNSSR